MTTSFRLSAAFLAVLMTFSACHIRKNTLAPKVQAVQAKQVNAHTQFANELPDNDHLLFGLPQDASTDTADHEHFLIKTAFYALSYSDRQGKPNWVCWHLSKTDLGTTGRSGKFHADSSLPSGFYKVKPSDYTKVGFDRGHDCPSGDRTSSPEANSATFLMSNMVPQAPRNNRQTWAHLEEYIRSLIQLGNEAYIMMGNYGTGGLGSVDSASVLAGGKITVPARIWKVAVILPEGDHDLARMDTSVRVIAVDTPNRQDIQTDWKPYITTVHQIDSSSGYHLLKNLPDSVLKVLERKRYAVN